MTDYEITVIPGESITQAVKDLPDDGRQALVHLTEGIYREKVEITRGHTWIEGKGESLSQIVWGDAANDAMEDGKKRGTFRTATFRTDADHITIRQVTIRNDAFPRDIAGQCIALYADGDWFTCEDCALESYQDTLFTAPLPPKEIIRDGFLGPKQFEPRKPQRHIYRRDRICGDIDFIFGSAAAWFEDCDIMAVDGRSGKETPYVAYCTAASTPEGQQFGYVFNQCRFLGPDVPDHSVYLGRPWRSFAKTVFLNCAFGQHIHDEAFHDWDKEDFHTNGMYAVYPRPEFADTLKWARILTDGEASAYTMEAFLKSL